MIRRAARIISVGLALIVAAVVAPPAGRAEPPAAAPGDAVALLPLDADKSLEIYGQPVASEIARALVAGNVRVVVVGPRMAVPERARLIVDGTIALGNAGAVTISLRIRNTVDGVVLETLAATAPGLTRIDSAAAELSARVLPIVRDRLAAVRRGDDHGRVVAARPAPAPAPAVLIAVADARQPPGAGSLPTALEAAAVSWGNAHHRQVQNIEAARLAGGIAAAASGGELAIGFWILGFTVEHPADAAAPAMATARVRVQVSRARALVFDRVVVTDTVLGERGMREPELAARVAREVLAILRPHLRRSVPSWP